MDSQPIEFLSHHLPLLFFAGLQPTPSTEDTSNLTSPSSNDQFQTLSNQLRHALTLHQSTLRIWDPRNRDDQDSKSTDFRVIIVEKNVRFPPRKARPTSTSSGPSSMIHSPLSPLTPTSPLYPDGIISPIWIRKHRDMIPSVFVLTLTLWEPPSSSISRKVMNENGIRIGSDEMDSKEFEEQKSSDHQLIYEILERKKLTSERGIKLVVVILTSKTMLDHPSLDIRLSYIRRQSGLDSRSSLFILSPVIESEIGSFVKTLKSEVFESALDYYREHSRKVRRKRSRNNSLVNPSHLHHPHPHSKSTQPILHQLGQPGWIVRADFKLATFAEFRQEYDVALKSYEDCWIGLSGMFSSTAILPPRTKRWAEAKVLIDCINIKICKFYLYSQETSRAMDQFRKHLNRFRELCNGWGIGDETFEYWSWLSKQYTMLAELIELGCRNGLKLPNLLPNPSTPFNDFNFLAFGNSLNTSSNHLLIPANVLLHPGFYHYQSALCAIQRRDKFKASELAEEQMRSIAKSKDQTATFQGSAALAYERKINHSELIIGLLTKAYELFKRFGSNRMTLFLAFKIAMIHFDHQDYLTAGKFFERIVSSARKEKFTPILHYSLMKFYESLKREIEYPLIRFDHENLQVEKFEKLLSISYELIDSNSSTVPIESKVKICNELQDLIQIPGNASNEPPRLIRLDMTNSTSPLRSEVVFWHPSVELGDSMDFQVRISAENPFPGYHLSFTSCELHFTNFPTIIINHQAQEVAGLRTLELHELSKDSLIFQKDLRWNERSNLMVFNGQFKPLKVGKVRLELVKFISRNTHDRFLLELKTKPINTHQNHFNLRWAHEVDEKSTELKFLSTETLSSFCQVRDKVSRARADIQMKELVLLDERVPIKVKLYNDEEDENLIFKLGVECRDPVSEKDILVIDEESHLINSKEFTLCSLKPHQSMEKTITLQPTQVGDRQIKLMINATKPSQVTSNLIEDHSILEESHLPFFSSWQLIKSILLQVKAPFLCEFDVRYLNSNRDPTNRKLLDCTLPDPWDGSDRVLVNVIIKSNHLIGLNLQQIEMQCENGVTPMRVLSSSISSDQEDHSYSLEPDSALSISYLIEVATRFQSDMVTGCALKITWERRIEESLEINSTHLTIHPFEFPIRKKPRILISHDLPPHLKIYEGCKVRYLMENESEDRIRMIKYRFEMSEEWMMSGGRSMDRIRLLPRMKRSIEVWLRPVVLGLIEIPKVKVFEIVHHPSFKRNRKGGGGLIEEILDGINELDVNEEEEEEEEDENGDGDGEDRVREVKIYREFELVKAIGNHQVNPTQSQPQTPTDFDSIHSGFHQILVFP